MRIFFMLIVFVALAGAHLEAGFDRTFGPDALEVGWDPTSPNVGEKTAFKVSIRDAATERSTNLTGVLIRLEKGEKVWFAGTLDLQGGEAAFTYAFPETGSWTFRVLSPGRFSETAEIIVPGKAPSFESAGWLLSGLFATALAFVLFRKGR